MIQYLTHEQSFNITGNLAFSVMLNEVLKISSLANGGKVIDCTFGGGGYSKEILKFSNTKVDAIDRDSKATLIANKIQKKFPQRFKFYPIKFSQLDNISDEYVDVIIFDLGLSSIQLNDLDRGFSFNSNKKLNMKMGLNEFSALEAINKLSEKNLKSIIKILGEEKEASRIAKNIVKSRKLNKIINTDDLVKIIEKVKKHFQRKSTLAQKLFKH